MQTKFVGNEFWSDLKKSDFSCI